MEVAADRRHLILGTAGHIDHGKTSLIRALTGVDTDRLPEEQRRGMTIELGFASLDIGDMRFGVVDVPGHERFVRTMVAGATGIDVALICVAADDSVMPQTVEHVEILDLLGVRRGVVAVTKCDMVDDELSMLVVEEVRELLAGTTLADSPIVRVSSQTGEGMDELRDALAGVVATDEGDSLTQSLPFRMPIDRVFTVAGRGTVVTGSVLSGGVAVGDMLTLWPGGAAARIREVECHGQSCGRASAGQRAAINLAGVERDDARRGGELATEGYISPGRILDVSLRCLSSHGRGIKSGAKCRLEMGTGEHMVRVVLKSQSQLPAGEVAYAQLRSAVPLAATYGQRFILRDESASRTIGGGAVLFVSARRTVRMRLIDEALLKVMEFGEDEARVEGALTVAGFSSMTPLQICALTGLPVPRVEVILKELADRDRLLAVGDSGMRVTAGAMDALRDRFDNWLRNYHQREPDSPGCPADAASGWLDRKSVKGMGRGILEQWVRAGIVVRRGRFVCLAEFAPALSSQDERIMKAMLELYLISGFQPPSPVELEAELSAKHPRIRKLIEIALASEEVVRIEGDMFLHTDIERKLRRRVTEVIEQRGGATVSEIRESLATTRKYVVPFLEYLDRVGVTVREGDRRVLKNRSHEKTKQTAESDAHG